MRLWMSDTKVPICLLMLVLMLLLLPLRWLGAAMIAAAVHELGHYGAVRLMRGRVSSMSIDTNGAVMNAFGLSPKENLVCLIAGPAAGLLLGLTFQWFPVTAICGIFQSLYNLLPIYPLDGGRILQSIAFIYGLGSRFYKIAEHAVLTFLFALCIYGKLRYGITMSIFLFIGILLLRKIPCKQRGNWI